MKNHISRVYLSLRGDFPPECVTKSLKLKPSKCIEKGASNAANRVSKISIWNYDVAEGEIIDLYETIDKFYSTFKFLDDELLFLINKYSIESRLVVVLKMVTESNASLPALGLTTQLISFLNTINTSVDVDMYLYED